MSIIPALYVRGVLVMPIYEYECRACGHRKEFIQKVDDSPIDLCEKCGARGTMKRLISAPMIQFKGSGWYITDYSSKGKEGKASSTSAHKSGATGDSPAKSEDTGKSGSDKSPPSKE